LKPA
jgi:exonuclease 1